MVADLGPRTLSCRFPVPDAHRPCGGDSKHRKLATSAPRVGAFQSENFDFPFCFLRGRSLRERGGSPGSCFWPHSRHMSFAQKPVLCVVYSSLLTRVVKASRLQEARTLHLTLRLLSSPSWVSCMPHGTPLLRHSVPCKAAGSKIRCVASPLARQHSPRSPTQLLHHLNHVIMPSTEKPTRMQWSATTACEAQLSGPCGSSDLDTSLTNTSAVPARRSANQVRAPASHVSAVPVGKQAFVFHS